MKWYELVVLQMCGNELSDTLIAARLFASSDICAAMRLPERNFYMQFNWTNLVTDVWSFINDCFELVIFFLRGVNISRYMRTRIRYVVLKRFYAYFGKLLLSIKPEIKLEIRKYKRVVVKCYFFLQKKRCERLFMIAKDIFSIGALITMI